MNALLSRCLGLLSDLHHALAGSLGGFFCFRADNSRPWIMDALWACGKRQAADCK